MIEIHACDVGTRLLHKGLTVVRQADCYLLCLWHPVSISGYLVLRDLRGIYHACRLVFKLLLVQQHPVKKVMC